MDIDRLPASLAATAVGKCDITVILTTSTLVLACLKHNKQIINKFRFGLGKLIHTTYFILEIRLVYGGIFKTRV